MLAEHDLPVRVGNPFVDLEWSITKTPSRRATLRKYGVNNQYYFRAEQTATLRANKKRRNQGPGIAMISPGKNYTERVRGLMPI